MSRSITDLINEMTVHDVRRRAAAAEALCQSGDGARDAAVALVRASCDENESVRDWAAEALGNIGPPSVADVPDLVALVHDKRNDIAYWAVTLLGRLGEEAQAAVPPLVDALTSHASMAVRQRAAWAVGRIGPAAAAALEPLKHAANSDDPRLARLSKQAIERLSRQE